MFELKLNQSKKRVEEVNVQKAADFCVQTSESLEFSPLTKQSRSRSRKLEKETSTNLKKKQKKISKPVQKSENSLSSETKSQANQNLEMKSSQVYFEQIQFHKDELLRIC